MKVAIVHEWLARARGAERVLDAMCEAFPESDLFTLFDCGEPMPARIRQRRVVTSFLQAVPRKLATYRHLLPLMPLAVESFDLRDYDVVVSSHFCVAKGVITRPDTCHVAYVHSPPRWVWESFPLFFGRDRVGGAVRAVGSMVSHYVRMFDESSAARPDHYLSNSRTIGAAIERRYRRHATVLPPPVDLGRFAASGGGDDYYLSLGGLVPQKRVELAIAACNQLGRRLKVVGAGPEARRLVELAGPTVELVGWPSDEQVARLLEGCRALLFPGFEDFGIAMVEALACGRPVVAYRGGGATEILSDGSDDHPATGVFFDEQSVDGLIDGIVDFESRAGSFVPARLRERAEQFDRKIFVRRFRRLVEQMASGRVAAPVVETRLPAVTPSWPSAPVAISGAA
jgi:glycosyltransferase involved in cell wall biosynthesis